MDEVTAHLAPVYPGRDRPDSSLRPTRARKSSAWAGPRVRPGQYPVAAAASRYPLRRRPRWYSPSMRVNTDR